MRTSESMKPGSTDWQPGSATLASSSGLPAPESPPSPVCQTIVDPMACGRVPRRDCPDLCSKRPLEQIAPNAAHLAIVQFEKIGKCDFLVSQNVDNLHLKSGFPFEKLAELHGNQFRLRCWPCEKTFPLADFRTSAGERRRCRGKFVADLCPDCGMRLKKSVINFGDPMPRADLDAAFQWARKADLMIAVGSSCQVIPAAHVPRATKEAGGRLVIINLGKTDLDNICDLRFRAKAGKLLPNLLQKVKSRMEMSGQRS